MIFPPQPALFQYVLSQKSPLTPSFTKHKPGIHQGLLPFPLPPCWICHSVLSISLPSYLSDWPTSFHHHRHQLYHFPGLLQPCLLLCHMSLHSNQSPLLKIWITWSSAWNTSTTFQCPYGKDGSLLPFFLLSQPYQQCHSLNILLTLPKKLSPHLQPLHLVSSSQPLNLNLNISSSGKLWSMSSFSCSHRIEAFHLGPLMSVVFIYSFTWLINICFPMSFLRLPLTT